MYILFEEHQYESRLVEKVLKDIYVLQDVNKKVSVQYVGYFYRLKYVPDSCFTRQKPYSRLLPGLLMSMVGVWVEGGSRQAVRSLRAGSEMKKTC